MTGSREPLEFPVPAAPLVPPTSFLEASAAFGLAFDDGDLERLGRYLALLLAANELVNLTAIREPDAVWHRHVLDALTLLPALADLDPCREISDIGSGGGVPGIPLAIAMPETHVTLIESTGKKAAFLDAAVAHLQLGNVRVICERAEVLGQRFRGDPPERERYDAVVARAVGPRAVIAELAVPLARVGGAVLLVKGERAAEELARAKQALHLLHAAHAGTIETPTSRVVVLEKLRPTPRTYPRRPGEPKRAPLGGRPA